MKFVENWPELCKPCFVDGWQEISPEKLIDLFEPITADGKAQEQTQKWFIQYVKFASEEALSRLLRFVSAFSAIPAWGMEKKISVKFLPDDDEKIYPESMVCFQVILFPTVHSTQEVFYKYMNKALEIESDGLVQLHKFLQLLFWELKLEALIFFKNLLDIVLSCL